MQDDMIQPLQHIDARSVDHAIELLQQYGSRATVIAGATDEINWLKNRQRAPEVLVDIKDIDGLDGISRQGGGGARIGALTSVTDVAESNLLGNRFGVVAEAAAAVATPQIRNQGTIGGNLAQDSRCWYYRGGFDCYRAGGNTCYAITGESRDHAITDYSRCITAHPSDAAVALMSVDAEVVIQGPRGRRREPLADFFVGPEENITVMNDLSGNEILTDILVPADWRDAAFYFEKVRDRESWDFPIVNIAAAFDVSGGRAADVRLVANGVAPKPKRLRAAERAVRGNRLTQATARAAAEATLTTAAPLEDNRYKIPLTRNLVRRAVLNAA